MAKKKVTKKKAVKKAVKKVAKKVAKKKVAKKKAVKKVAKKKVAKKAVKKVAKKKVAKKVAKKKAAKKVAKKKVAVKVAKPAPKPKAKPKKKMPAKERRQFRDKLIKVRERIVGQIKVLKNDSLSNADTINTEEDGTAIFDRQFALDMVSTERDSLFEVDEAIRRVDDHSYGVCETCEDLIEKPRLNALPFVRMCIKCQSDLERGNGRFRSRAALRR